MLFSGQDELRDTFVDAVTAAGPDAVTGDVVAAALDAAATWFPPERRDPARVRQAVIDANAGLHERELLKLARLAAELADALRARGLPAVEASLAGEATITVFKVAFAQWLVDADDRPLAEIQRALLAALPGTPGRPTPD